MSLRRPLNLTELTEFNPSLVTCFDAEGHPAHTDNDIDTLPYFENVVRQYEDMFSAYMYAQESILPALRKEGGIQSITPQQLVTWLNEIHARIAQQLADANHTQAGEFAKKPVARWQYQIVTGEIFNLHATGALKENVAFHSLCENGVSSDLAKAITKIIKKYRDKIKKKVKPADYEMVGNQVLDNILDDYYTDKISEDEKRNLERFMKICLHPSKLESAMLDYATKLLDAWKKCDPSNLDEICALLFQAFYELTEIHPYFNGNGRTATCLINIILRSLGQPSILIREPAERDDPTSLYCRTIDSLVVKKPTPTLFIELIKYRLQQHADHGFYKNKILDALILLRVNMFKIRQELASMTNPEIEEQVYQTVIKETQLAFVVEYGFAALLQLENAASNEMLCKYMQKSFDFYAAKLTALKAKCTTSASTSAVRFNPTAKTFTQDEKTALSNRLSELSGHQRWQVYPKNGALSAIHKMTDKEQALVLITALNATGACKAQILDSASGVLVQVDNIHFEKLEKAQAFAVAKTEGETIRNTL